MQMPDNANTKKKKKKSEGKCKRKRALYQRKEFSVKYGIPVWTHRSHISQQTIGKSDSSLR